MTKRTTQDLWNSKSEELSAMASEERVRLLELRMQKTGSSLKNVKEIRETKKKIARILTILQTKSLQK
ncbi:MAG: 50S ribosomal protein L29 [Patescibacteria group bacterium]